MEQLFGAAYAAALPARMTLFFFSLYKYLSILVFLLFPPCRCVVVLFNPRKNKQHHILNSSR